MPNNFTVMWISHHRKARCAPNPKYPKGMVIDTGERPACATDLPYPAECCGAWLVKCEVCETVVCCTAAGRPDDPKAIVVPCRKREKQDAH